MYEIKLYIRTLLNNFAIGLILKNNKYKDRILSQKLFDLAEEYNTRPRTNNYNQK